MKKILIALAIALAVAGGGLFAAHVTKVFFEDGGNELVVADDGVLSVESGGILNIESGGELQFAGTDVAAKLAASVAAPVAGVAAGYKVARGETALDGTNATPVAHGLTTCVAFVAILKGTAAPGVGTSVLTSNINGANVDVYAWKVTGTGDATLIASTGTESFYWVAIGT